MPSLQELAGRVAHPAGMAWAPPLCAAAAAEAAAVAAAWCCSRTMRL